MTAFALTIWAYQLTGKATTLALVGFFHVTPLLIISPIAGAIVDRSNRKLMMMLSDLASGMATIGILLLHSPAACRSGTCTSPAWSRGYSRPSNGRRIRQRSP